MHFLPYLSRYIYIYIYSSDQISAISGSVDAVLLGGGREVLLERLFVDSRRTAALSYPPRVMHAPFASRSRLVCDRYRLGTCVIPGFCFSSLGTHARSV